MAVGAPITPHETEKHIGIGRKLGISKILAGIRPCPFVGMTNNTNSTIKILLICGLSESRVVL